MNISLEAFTKLCAEHIRAGEPILAYWHNTGWGRLKLYPVMDEPDYIITGTPISGVTGRPTGCKAIRVRVPSREARDSVLRQMRQDCARVDEIEEIAGKERKVKAATVKAMRKAIEKMRKSRYTSVSLCAVDYDGQSMQAEGDDAFVAAMQEAMA